MGKSHTVKPGETLGLIAIQYYGLFARWTTIRDANPQLVGRKTGIDGSPLIYPGDVLIIAEPSPPTAVDNDAATILAADGSNNLIVKINGKSFSGFTGWRLKLSVDTLDAFSFSAPWDNESKELRAAFAPFKYAACAVYYDRQLIFNGALLTSAPEVSPNSRTITLEGYPLCGVLADCDLPQSQYPPSYNNLDLQQIAASVASAFGLQVETIGSAGAVFEKVEYEPGRKLLDFLRDLASQRGFLFTNTPSGHLKFWKPSAPVLAVSFKEGELPFISCKPNFNAQEFYSHLTGFTKTENEANSESYTYENKYLTKAGVFRPISFLIEDASGSTLSDSVKAKAGRMVASAVSYELTVSGHKDKSGKLYQKNLAVSLLSPGAMIYRETRFLVDSVEFICSPTEGNQTVFSLVLPVSRGGLIPEVFPWEE